MPDLPFFYFKSISYSIGEGGFLPRNTFAINDKINNTIKIKNNILAISRDIISTPEKPRNPAISASTKKVMIRFIIGRSLKISFIYFGA
jgi:hypothetical protein